MMPTASTRSTPWWSFLRQSNFWFLAPAVLWGLTFTLYPVIHALGLSFQRARLGQANSFIGFDNFARTLSDPQFWSSLRFTVLFVLITVTLQLLIGLALALLLNRPMPFRGVVRAILMLPLFATPVGIGYLGIAMFQESTGPINTMLMNIGGTLGFAPEAWDVPWRSHPVWAGIAVGLMDTWQWMPFCFLILLAGIQAIPDELYEAARLDTDNGVQVFRFVTLPLLRPILGITILLRMIEAWKVIDIPFAFTKGGPGTATQTYTIYVWRQAFTSFDLGYASALGILFLILVLVVVNLILRFGGLRTSVFSE
jgi:multiple sugar transport system permease protein